MIPDCPAPSVGVYSEVGSMYEAGDRYEDTLLWISKIVRYCNAIDRSN